MQYAEVLLSLSQPNEGFTLCGRRGPCLGRETRPGPRVRSLPFHRFLRDAARSPALQVLHRLADFFTDLRHCVLPFETYCAIARRSKARASSVPSRGRSVRLMTFHPSFPRLSSQRLSPTRWMRKPAEVPWPESSRGVPCRSGTIICK